VSIAVFTSRSWNEARMLPEEKGTLPLRYLCTAALVTIFLQLVLGATLRHSAKWDQPLPVELILAHIGGAFAVTMALGSTSISVLRRHKGETFLTRPAAIALVLLVVQLFLGLASYLTRVTSFKEPQPLQPMVGVTVAHVACGALIFATTIVLTLRTYRVLPASEAAMEMAGRPQES
jgi:heme A synthase